MNENHVLDQLSAYISGELDERSRSLITAHIASCSECRKEHEELSSLWTSLSRIPAEEPGEIVGERFYEMLHSYEKEQRDHMRPIAGPNKRWLDFLMPKQPAVQFAFFAVMLIIGIVAGSRMQTAPSNDKELAQLHEEVRDMGRLLTVSLLQQQSASERLRGVSMSYQAEQHDPEVETALLHTLKYDPNVNVRLAALDAISKSVSQNALRQELLQSLPNQPSPLLQIAIIDLMVQNHATESLDIFKRMMQNPEINVSVKKKIQQSIQQLS